MSRKTFSAAPTTAPKALRPRAERAAHVFPHAAQAVVRSAASAFPPCGAQEHSALRLFRSSLSLRKGRLTAYVPPSVPIKTYTRENPPAFTCRRARGPRRSFFCAAPQEIRIRPLPRGLPRRAGKVAFRGRKISHLREQNFPQVKNFAPSADNENQSLSKPDFPPCKNGFPTAQT